MPASSSRNTHLTFKANEGVGRHGWLRLTPAYSVELVRCRTAALPAGSTITDPFSGTGTTVLAAAENGHLGQSLDVNPFLIWLGQAKTRQYSHQELRDAASALGDLLSTARSALTESDLWQPNLFRIERWWSPGVLRGLRALRHAVELVGSDVAAADLYRIALCRTLIDKSNASFGHQSMSFKPIGEQRLDFSEANATVDRFGTETGLLLRDARLDLAGSARILIGDARAMTPNLRPCDLLLTSPPYVNRMSYIRELRPYMYWLGYLDRAAEAGDLDWHAIGGTWGTATSRLADWQPSGPTIPVDTELSRVRARIATDGARNGMLLSNYVGKYFHDMWQHFQATRAHVASGGAVSYIVGNSTFYGHLVPVQEWFATMLRAVGFERVTVTTIRKRNSNRQLYEFDVSARCP